MINFKSRLGPRRALWWVGLATISWMSATFADAGHMHDSSSDGQAQASFAAENAATMSKMMAGMDVPASGDVDRDFVTSMSAHHQGAIDMAMTMLKYGRNEQLRRIAQEIIVDQLQEIAAMRQAMGDPLPASEAAPTQVSATHP